MRVFLVASILVVPGFPLGASTAAESDLRRLLTEEEYGAALAYMRCETPVRRNAFDEAAKPDAFLSALQEEHFSAKSLNGQPALPITVWPGTIANVQMTAGYGFFAIIQTYDRKDLQTILSHLKVAGWELEARDSQRKLLDRKGAPAGSQKIKGYVGRKTDRNITLTINVAEAILDLDYAGPPLNENGVTVTCGYAKSRSPSQ